MRANSTYGSNEYFLPVMVLVFLRHAYSRYLAAKDEIAVGSLTRVGRTRPVTREDFSQKDAIFVRPAARFDHLVALLKKPDLGKADIERLKKVAKELLRTLKAEKLRVDQWREKEATQSAVKVAIHDFLYRDETGLPAGAYSHDDVTAMTEAVFAHVYRAYPAVPSPFYDDVTAA